VQRGLATRAYATKPASEERIPARAYVSRIPQDVNEAKASPEWPKWETAMKTEYEKITKNQTYVLVPRSEATGPIIPLKWVFDHKLDKDGNVIDAKGRVVLRGDKQVKYINYDEKFSPVMKSSSRNALIGAATLHDWFIYQGDFEAAYLNGVLWDESEDGENISNSDLKNPIFVEQVPGFEVPGKEDWVGKLMKGLYGLVQAGRIWYTDLSDTLVNQLQFTRSESDHAVFYKKDNDRVLFIGLHVDDPLIIGSNLDDVLKVIDQLGTFYTFNNKGEINHFLGTTYVRDWEKGTISASQAVYIDAAVNQFGLADAYPVTTPILPGTSLGNQHCPVDPEEIESMKKIPFRMLIGLLLYIANGTRPDICYSVNLLAQVMHNPGRIHWEAAKRIVRYLKGTRHYCLTWSKYGGGLVGYSDANFASEDLGWKSMSGYVFMLAGGAISWSAKKQDLIALSTAESEYIAMVHAMKELLYLRNLFSELFGSLSKPTILRADNQAAIAMVKNDQFHPRTKHIAIRYHKIREVVTSGDAIVEWIHTSSNIADIFTKTLPVVKLSGFSDSLGLLCA
jgi:hypothetical protein